MDTAKEVLQKIADMFKYVLDLLKEIFGAKDEEAEEVK